MGGKCFFLPKLAQANINDRVSQKKKKEVNASALACLPKCLCLKKGLVFEQ